MPRTPRTVVRPPPEPDPNLGYFAWLGEWGRIHPIRAIVCVYFLAVLGSVLVGALASCSKVGARRSLGATGLEPGYSSASEPQDAAAMLLASTGAGLLRAVLVF